MVHTLGVPRPPNAYLDKHPHALWLTGCGTLPAHLPRHHATAAPAELPLLPRNQPPCQACLAQLQDNPPHPVAAAAP